MKTTRTVASLAATIVTFGSLAGGAYGAVLLTWTENAGDGNDVTVTASGTFFTPSAPFSTGNSSFTVANSSELHPNVTPTWGRIETQTISTGFISSFGDILTGSFVNLKGLDVGYLIFDASLSPETTHTASGTATFNNVSFEDLFGAGVSPADTFSWTGTDGQTLTSSVTSIPEPSSALLLGLGALGLVARRKRPN